MDSVSITFGGLDTIAGAEFTLSRGVSPSCCTLFIRPGSPLTNHRGPLALTMGGQSLTFPDMTSDVMHVRKSGKLYWALDLYDRRYYWKHGYINGAYNVRQSDGKLKGETNARELANKLLTALGETGFNTTLMPTNVYPFVNWNGTNPAYALANLLDYCCCTLAPGFDNNMIVYPLGVGDDLPDTGSEGHPSMPLKIPVPATITLICGDDLFQSKLKLAAYSIGTDSNIKTIDETDYEPAAGWGTDFYMFFPNVATDERSYAFNSMYRLFRPVSQAQGGLTPPGCTESVIKVSQYDLNSFTCSQLTNTDSVKSPGGPYLDGTFWPQSDHAVNTAANTVYTGRFAIQDGMVVTDYPVIKWSSSNAVQEPELYLTTSYSVWNEGLTDKVRYSKSKNLGGAGYLILRRPEMFRVFKTNYSMTSPTDTESNSVAIDAQADAYLNLFAQKYADPWIDDREYYGILPMLPDGKIAQVRWRLGHCAPTTRASKNFEFDTHNVSGAERRRRELVAQLAENAR